MFFTNYLFVTLFFFFITSRLRLSQTPISPSISPLKAHLSLRPDPPIMEDKAPAVVGDDGSMRCGDHAFQSNPGGICAFCLQEKLGKLVDSSKSSSTTLFFTATLSSSSTSPPSIRSSSSVVTKSHISTSTTGSAASATVVVSPARKTKGGGRSRIPFYGFHGHIKRRKGKKKSGSVGSTPAATSFGNDSVQVGFGGSGLVLKRSNSVAARTADSSRKKWFWPFVHFYSDPNGRCKEQGVRGKDLKQQNEQQEQGSKVTEAPKAAVSATVNTKTREEQKNDSSFVIMEETEESPSGSQISSSFGRKVSRSRSVGCGNRSFSGDILERISTGLGDCALRRVESQRDPKPKTSVEEDEVELKKRHPMMRCGIFSGMGLVSSSSCSSSFWLPVDFCGGGTPHCRSRGWGWAFASPMRAFRSSSSYKTSTTDNCYNTATTTINATAGVCDINSSSGGVSTVAVTNSCT